MNIWQYRSVVHQKSVTLTNAQILTLPSVPVNVVSAPGINRIIMPVMGAAILDSRNGAYGASVDAAWQLIWGEYNRYASTPSKVNRALTQARMVHVPLPMAGSLLYNTATSWSGVVYGEDMSGQWLDRLYNQPLQFGDVYFGVANYTAGHASNTLTVAVVYTIYDVKSGEFVV